MRETVITNFLFFTHITLSTLSLTHTHHNYQLSHTHTHLRECGKRLGLAAHFVGRTPENSKELWSSGDIEVRERREREERERREREERERGEREREERERGERDL